VHEVFAVETIDWSPPPSPLTARRW